MYINRIRFRNFKSFEYVDIPLSKGLVCLAGPNGSGKSNICDAIRFALGEMSLRAVRAKKVADLITTGAAKAEIFLELEGEKAFEIKRAIRGDGKTLYRLNGKRMTRSLVLDSLRPYGVEASSHNVIAQGEVERIVQMSPKERREIIDHVAGISEYEQKKKESLKELDAVEQKIGEATIVLKEREGVLFELEKERDAALRYAELKDYHTRLKGSVLYQAVKKTDEDHSRAVKKSLDLEKKLAELEKQNAEIEGKVNSNSGQKDAVVAKINELGSTHNAVRQVEDLRREISVAEADLKNKSELLEKNAKELAGLKADKQKLKERLSSFGSEASGWNADLSKAGKEIADLEKQKAELEKKEGASHKELSSARGELEAASKELEAKKDALRAIEFESAKAGELKESRERELQRIKGEGVSSEKADALRKEIEKHSKEIERISAEMDHLFSKEKQANARVVECEKELLSSKEKWAVARMAAGREPANDAIDFIRSLRDKRVVSGIHGTVGELCSFEPEHAIAIEASAGARLNYIIVDSIETASEAIKLLKQKKAGRCTFIPLDRRVSQGDGAGAKESMGLLLDFVKYDAKLDSAMKYVFGDTLLVRDIDHAKRVGIGKARMVTLEGDVVEPSSVITGGIFRPRLALREKKEAEALEKEIEKLRAERDRLVGEIEGIREQMNSRRKAKAELEVKSKSLEIELHALEEKDARQKKLLEEARALSEQVKRASEEVQKRSHEAGELKKAIHALDEKRSRLQHSVSLLEKAMDKSAFAGLEEKLSALKESRASLEGKLGGKKNEISMLESQAEQVEKDMDSSEWEEKELKKSISELKKSIESNSHLLKEKEEALKGASTKLQALYGERDELQKQVEALAMERGKLSGSLERARENKAEYETNKKVLEQQLADLKAEFAEYGSIQIIEGKRDDLQAKVGEVDKELASLGMVNMRAPEVYEEKKKDLEDLKVRVEKLAEEKSAIMLMIEELESKKLAIFQETFRVVAENFKKLFGYIFAGEGILSLQIPSDPFNSGLILKVRDSGKDRFIEAMSGGERSMLALLFVFAIHMHKPAPFYILDEVEAALDKNNSKKFADLLRTLAKNTQFIVVTHNDTVLSAADSALGVAKTPEGSRVVGVNLAR